MFVFECDRRGGGGCDEPMNCAEKGDCKYIPKSYACLYKLGCNPPESCPQSACPLKMALRVPDEVMGQALFLMFEG